MNLAMTGLMFLAIDTNRNTRTVSQNRPNRVNTAILLMTCVESRRCLPVRSPKASIIRSVVSLNPNPPKVWRYSSGMGDEGQGEAMVRARFRVNGAGVCLQPPRGDLATVWGRWARRDGGERTQQDGLADQGGASLRGVRLAGWRVSCRRAPSGWEWNRSQPCQGASELGFPRPALGQMQGKAAR